MTRGDFDLSRFLDAQDAGGTYARALAELRAGAKRSHWMWFVFPQVRGLGSSAMAERYAIGSLDEARAYWEHPILGARLRECLAALAALPTAAATTSPTTAADVFGAVDAMKLRSSLTLFHRAAPGDEALAQALSRWFGGVADERTDAILSASGAISR
jgi:uncharacterized protein (DUF1810 family)